VHIDFVESIKDYTYSYIQKKGKNEDRMSNANVFYRILCFVNKRNPHIQLPVQKKEEERKQTLIVYCINLN
jgi:hypothetical protein